jgi:hypothetical protein
MREARLVLLCIAVALGACSPRREQNPAGADLYRRYCASCHGPNGAGDGPASKWLEPRPVDLTRSALDLPGLAERIDGRREVGAHGSSDMPVWGEVFSEMLLAEPKAREITRLRVDAIAEHVRSLRNVR